ncbi:hypothetical protein AYM17_01810 [Coxiella burnetii]|uniref:Uncharacterized protein n=1 Tax=Coxiella burnetii (strain RSA 493 / Nine Mile phase I) TaxID=227377 RepID=Q83B78_COXBU|nr:hypothetical protein [Coxiella burnetii]NP_820617.1 hypothetical protein CBU_1635 [Coxiella burnetii RSA 493]AAO91131.1 hypothetical protein CBU_1635 [Coxiella burnetii RSA 493]ACJ17818.1 hypothetical protein CbuG_0387 [Coxiella burnetii CbuG_Q212]ARI66392.1 hypothetical protein B7L74_08395 [Coxiella burnetii]ARK27844.1 hypothetical protein BMW92_08170 [Coxiella burnetii]ATN66252.1 hypothetical protein AYM17_01810 [Coxiella burnetii]
MGAILGGESIAPELGRIFVRTRCESLPGRSKAAIPAAYGPHKNPSSIPEPFHSRFIF